MAKSAAVSSIFIILLTITIIYMCNGANAAEKSYVDFVKETIASHKIVIFSKSYCGYSKRTKDIFAQLNETPFVIEEDLRDDGSRIQEAMEEVYMDPTVPQVFINDQHIGGSIETKNAYESGELQKLLGADSAGKKLDL